MSLHSMDYEFVVHRNGSCSVGTREREGKEREKVEEINECIKFVFFLPRRWTIFDAANRLLLYKKFSDKL